MKQLLIDVLVRVGITRPIATGFRSPVQIGSPEWWAFMWRSKDFAGLFRNRPGVIRDIPGRLLPRRWGFYVLGLEVGDRG